MAFTESRIFRAFLQINMLKDPGPAVTLGAYTNIVADAMKVSLFGNTGTPDRDAAITSTGYNTGQWTTGNEITGSGIWAAAGRSLASQAFTASAGGIVMYDAADLAGAGTGTLAAVFGCFVYDDATTAGTGGIADQGVCYNYFGGSQSVTSGTFTIVWNASGLFRFTV